MWYGGVYLSWKPDQYSTLDIDLFNELCSNQRLKLYKKSLQIISVVPEAGIKGRDK